MPDTPKEPAFKKGDRAKRTCDSDCTRIRKCRSYDRTGTGKEVEVDRMNPLVHGCYDVVDKNGIQSTCPRDRLAKVEETPAYWGISQDEARKPPAKPLPVPEEKKCDPAIASVGDFGYGVACSFVTCHANLGEDHSSSCPKTGPFNPEVIE